MVLVVDTISCLFGGWTLLCCSNACFFTIYLTGRGGFRYQSWSVFNIGNLSLSGALLVVLGSISLVVVVFAAFLEISLYVYLHVI